MPFQNYQIGDSIVYRIKVKTLPGLVNNVYAIVSNDEITLIDAGYGKKAAAYINESIKLISKEHNARLAKIIITHSHIDHFGAINQIEGDFKAYAHVPDAYVIKDFKKSLCIYEKKLKSFLKTTKTPKITAAMIKIMYKMHKKMFNGYNVIPLNEGQFGELEIILTQGHSPGHVCIGLDNAIFTGDHLLPKITPTQSPYSLTPGCGLENYLNSLKKTAKLDYKIAFPGHEEPFTNIKERCNEIIKFHEKRLDIMENACKGKTMYQTAKAVFGKKMIGYHVLLGLLETAAHLEYLFDNGRIKQSKGRFNKIA